MQQYTTIEKPESQIGHIMAEVAEVKSCWDVDEAIPISMELTGQTEVWVSNTMWCLIGCSITNCTIAAFNSFTESGWSTMSIMMLAMFNGIMTPIILETIILSKQMILKEAFKVAVGMS